MDYSDAMTILTDARDADRWEAELNGLAPFIFASKIIVQSYKSARTGQKDPATMLRLAQSVSKNWLGNEHYWDTKAHLAAVDTNTEAHDVVAWVTMDAYHNLFNLAHK